MRISRIHVDSALVAGSSLPLDRDTSHYLGKVLRAQASDPLVVFNSDNGEFSAQVESVSKQAVVISVGDQLQAASPPALTIHLGLGLSRGDRMDFAVQKSTELGVMRLTPVYTEFGDVRIKQTERAENKRRHWQRIAINACEQSGRIMVPKLDTPEPLAHWLADREAGYSIILDPTAELRLSKDNDSNELTQVNLLIGPEGGFSDQEIQLAEDSGFVRRSLGTRILRTETAPVAALAILQHLYGDM